MKGLNVIRSVCIPILILGYPSLSPKPPATITKTVSLICSIPILSNSKNWESPTFILNPVGIDGV